MVKLTTLLIEKKRFRQQLCKHLTKETEKDNLKKITHIFMNDQFIDEIDDFTVCKNLKVIYLQKNNIERIENLDFAVKLTHLYLQHNEIVKIENLERLVALKKLYLGYNNISVIEGLENLVNLTELHVEKQRLAYGKNLCFDLRTLQTLSVCLKYLNVSNNKITSLSEINNFEQLVTLEAKDNLIEDIVDLTKTVHSLVKLKNLFLNGNPVSKLCRFRENLIANSYSLIVLDNKSFTENSRIFLRKFKDEKILQSRKKKEPSLREDITNSLNLPPAFKRSVSRAMFQNVEPKFTFSGLSLITDSQLFPSWTTASSVKALKGERILPRQLWKNKNKPKQNDQSMKQNTELSSILKL